MNLIAVKDLKTPKILRQRLQREGELLLTSDGKPMAVLINVAPTDNPTAVITAIHQARERMALSRIREAASRNGAAQMTTPQINREILAARAERARRK
ncbi:MAG: hypothetical protein JW841_11270 [Deltaproteobacteria bacterium]|nr:hypothetical protein [Deltaproteobacteria bacterium]